MNPRFAATMALQWPAEGVTNWLAGSERCPHCQSPIMVYRFAAPDGHWIETFACAKHGDVVPMRLTPMRAHENLD